MVQQKNRGAIDRFTNFAGGPSPEEFDIYIELFHLQHKQDISVTPLYSVFHDQMVVIQCVFGWMEIIY
jgi:hypothetical protein